MTDYLGYFSEKVLRKFGFSESFIDLVWQLISNCWYSVLINGHLEGFFHSSKGVRQGDPLSPALFIIAAEVLSRGLKFLSDSKLVLPYSVPRGCSVVSHLAFADDLLIFTNGSLDSLQVLMSFLVQYEKESGHLINRGKSCFTLGSSAPANRGQTIAAFTGFIQKSLPLKYLGCNLYIGRSKLHLFDDMLAKIEKRLAGWKGKLLTQEGRLVLIQHVLQSIPIHVMSAFSPPKSVLNRIDSLCAKFF